VTPYSFLWPFWFTAGLLYRLYNNPCLPGRTFRLCPRHAGPLGAHEMSQRSRTSKVRSVHTIPRDSGLQANSGARREKRGGRQSLALRRWPIYAPTHRRLYRCTFRPPSSVVRRPMRIPQPHPTVFTYKKADLARRMWMEKIKNRLEAAGRGQRRCHISNQELLARRKQLHAQRVARPAQLDSLYRPSRRTRQSSKASPER